MSGGAGYVINGQALKRFAPLVEDNLKRDVVHWDPTIMERPQGCKTSTDEGIEDLELGKSKSHSLGFVMSCPVLEDV